MEWFAQRKIGSKVAKIALAACLAAVPFELHAWWSWNRHEVVQVSDGVWEVLNEVGSGPQDYWCGIGDFASRQLRTKATQRIYIWQGIGPAETRPGRKSVKFSLSPPPGSSPQRGYSLSIKTPGYSQTAAAAQNYCNDYFEDLVYYRF